MTIIKCSKCGQENTDAIYCIRCGNKLNPLISIKKSIVFNSINNTDVILDKSIMINFNKNHRLRCPICGAPITEYSIFCPYCSMEIKDDMQFTKKSQEKEKDRIAKRPENCIEISKEALDSLVTAAIEVFPCETIGLLFGEKNPTRIVIAQALQTVEFRTQNEVSPSIISEERIIETTKKLRGLEYLGGFHSHPYEDPKLISNKIELGICLSDQDKKYIITNKIFLEIVAAVFPWERWSLPQDISTWEERKGTLLINKDIKIGKYQGNLIWIALYMNTENKISLIPLVISNLKIRKCPICGAYLKTNICTFCGYEVGG